MTIVKVGIIGLGNMGTSHAKRLYNREIEDAILTAVCDVREERMVKAREEFGDRVKRYLSIDDFFEHAEVDGIIIATPHYEHPDVAIRAFAKGWHVLCEKPAGVYTKNVRLMNEAAAKSGKVFSMMFNQRTNPLYQKMRELIQSGELGEIKRTNWIITDWYRPQSYYDSGGWRATWKGEGGGVMLNQSPHQLDLWQWITGMMPTRIRSFCGFGKYHDIEVEDDVTAYVEYENGATGLFVTSTGEAPGTNRFEVAGNRGKLVIENGKLTFWRLRQSEREFNQTFKGGFGAPECWKIDIPVRGRNDQHTGILKNWVDAIVNDAELLAPGEEGIKSLAIANGVYLSSWLDDWVDMPLDEDLFYEKLQEEIAASTFRKTETEDVTLDVSGTH
ncbi:Gfo/Idh/MocA family oxidoreductase [Lederbergia sp. NSJ-179]|uniref:Gfo/Idh/MocA family protein n=1 Tax=Lederbergia sp. NSJ-179 TaxID=2931402 RepID=UPI001FD40156|nr:Gfo/Idh/MocA family oxidoreductase [Lederbergia sp. NSJ-179]MCJ7842575.1 Gfo/Idh/MocA family oxidoreductase [Lederbergia sp. NSJ-179]